VLNGLLRRMLASARARRGASALDADLARARALHEHGDAAGARALCERILARSPGRAEAHALLGMTLGAAGELERAEVHFAEALRLDPDCEEAHLGLGNVHRLQGRAEAALEAYREAVRCNPDSAAAHYSLGLALRAAARPEEAAPHLARAQALAPGWTEVARDRTLCEVALGRYDAALAAAEDGLRRAPEAGELYAALGLVHQKMHRPHAALECYERARALGHADADYWNNYGIVMQELGRLEEALAAYERALALRPDFPLARFHRGLARLLAGDYAGGWPDYEMRLASEDCPRRPHAYPRWDGSPLEGRTLLVYGEQGLGDEIMFASCLPQVLAAARRCIVECSPRLEALFRRSFPQALVYAARPDRAIPEDIRAQPIDFEAPSGSLPLYLRRTPGDFPQHCGYLRADPRRVAAWRERLAQLGPGLKVGISWAGGTHRTRSPLRSIPLERWLPVLRATPAHFVSLQYGDAEEALAALEARHGVRIEHWREAIEDYDETAALVCALDLVVSVQTAIVHLAGALGRPAWAMVGYAPEWRYGFAGERMAWYPSVRLFRQPAFGEWDPVLSRVAAGLRALGESVRAGA
jgi:tetratricopeptide (TPR) repeat protein